VKIQIHTSYTFVGLRAQDYTVSHKNVPRNFHKIILTNIAYIL